MPQGMGSEHLDPVRLAFIADGRELACDAALVSLMQCGAAFYNPSWGRIVAGPLPADLPPMLRSFYDCIGSGITRAQFLRRVRPIMNRMREDLVSRGLIVPWHAWPTMALPSALALFGVAKIAVGIYRDRPVGALIMIVFLAILSILIFALAGHVRTRQGAKLLAEYRRDRRRLARAPQAGEFAMAVALGGTGVLIDTAFADYARASGARDGSGGSGCGGGGGSSGGSSCGSSCGGCGGGD
jgi:uncharacterized protein (TIGR04222 family)